MTKLTPAQAHVLRACLAADDGVADTTDIAKPTLWSLIKRGCISPTDSADRVTITDAGRAAIAEIDAEAAVDAPAPAKAPKGKLGILVGLLRQDDGATVEAMMAATGWQAHSVRGAIAGAIKKALGHTVTSTKTEGGRVYRIVEEA
jgi:DNA-binding MarR family transcriptional regulator